MPYPSRHSETNAFKSHRQRSSYLPQARAAETSIERPDDASLPPVIDETKDDDATTVTNDQSVVSRPAQFSPDLTDAETAILVTRATQRLNQVRAFEAVRIEEPPQRAVRRNWVMPIPVATVWKTKTNRRDRAAGGDPWKPVGPLLDAKALRVDLQIADRPPVWGPRPDKHYRGRDDAPLRRVDTTYSCPCGSSIDYAFRDAHLRTRGQRRTLPSRRTRLDEISASYGAATRL